MIKDFLTLDIIQSVCLWVVYRLKWYQVPDSMIHGEEQMSLMSVVKKNAYTVVQSEYTLIF